MNEPITEARELLFKYNRIDPNSLIQRRIQRQYFFEEVLEITDLAMTKQREKDAKTAILLQGHDVEGMSAEASANLLGYNSACRDLSKAILEGKS